MDTVMNNAIRTEWDVSDKVKFFRGLLSFFPQLELDEVRQIEEHLTFEFDEPFEIANYDENVSSDEPSFIFVYEEGKVFLDFLFPYVMNRQLNIINYLVFKIGKMTKKREITQKEWIGRFNLLEERFIKQVVDEISKEDEEWGLESEKS